MIGWSVVFFLSALAAFFLGISEAWEGSKDSSAKLLFKMAAVETVVGIGLIFIP
ncbi:MAG: hypothetical protein WC242_05395 [Candidatus Paceibacterota bacterium]|jgi:hypothetical protein